MKPGIKMVDPQNHAPRIKKADFPPLVKWQGDGPSLTFYPNRFWLYLGSLLERSSGT